MYYDSQSLRISDRCSSNPGEPRPGDAGVEERKRKALATEDEPSSNVQIAPLSLLCGSLNASPILRMGLHGTPISPKFSSQYSIELLMKIDCNSLTK